MTEEPRHETPGGPSQGDYQFLDDHLLEECRAMAKHALHSGLKVPGSLMQALTDLERGGIHKASDTCAAQLTSIHDRLVQIVAPATPRTILLLEQESSDRGFLSFLGPIPFIRRMMVTADLSLIVFILASLSKDVNFTSGDLFSSSGMPLLMNFIFYLAASGLGASFAILFQANRYIMNGTFDPRFESYYWIKLVMGLVAGVILSQLVPINLSGMLHHMGRPTLAMLGGFSASVVYRILNRLVMAVESLVQGDTHDIIASREQALKAHFDEHATQNRIKMASSLADLKQQIDSGADPAQIRQKLNSLLDDLLPAGLDGDGKERNGQEKES